MSGYDVNAPEGRIGRYEAPPKGARYRYRYECGHSSPVTMSTAWPSPVRCRKCGATTTVVSHRRLSDKAKLPSETRRGMERTARRDADASAVARDRPANHAARHWKVPD